MEGKGAFAKVVQKTLNRTRAKVLQNLGKADKTTDGKFEDHVADFTRQQAAAGRLQKEVKHYVNCIKATVAATKSLYTVIRETYEAEWVDLHSVDSAIRSLDMLYANYEAELVERVNTDLHSYVELFNPMKEKINKRRRKLLDYDNAKHSWESARNAKKPDDFKIAKTEEAMQETERLYNELNEELHRELPKFYDYRIDFIASNLSRLYSTESTFHSETGKLTDQLHQLMDRVPKAEQRVDLNQSNTSSVKYSKATSEKEAPPTPDEDLYNDIDDDFQAANERESNGYLDPNEEPRDSAEYNGQEYKRSDPSQSQRDSVTSAGSGVYLAPASSEGQVNTVSEANSQQDSEGQSADTDTGHSGGDNNIGPTAVSKDMTVSTEAEVIAEYDATPSNVAAAEQNSGSGGDNTQNHSAVNEYGDDEAVYQNIDPGQQDDNTQSAPTSSHQVLATHLYNAEDEDELSFEAGEIINIIQSEEPDDQDEGWLMGISTKTGKKGLFPENFTRKIIKRNSATAKPSS